MTEVVFEGNVRDNFIGHILNALFGQTWPTVKIPIPGSITGTFVEGENVTETTSGAVGVLRRLDAGGSAKALYVSVTSGTFAGSLLLTGGTSGATATGGTIQSPAAVRHHVFRRLNSNTPVTYSIYGSDPVSDDRSLFCALDSFELECVVGNFTKFSAKFMGKKLASTSAQTPTFTAQNPLMAKHAGFKMASAFTGLDAASVMAVERFKISFNKNLESYQSFGTTDVDSFHNKEFGEISGEITFLYNAITQRDLVIDSTKQAMRLTIANTGITIGSSANPTLQIDLPSVGFREFTRTTGNGELVKATLRFTAEYDLTRAMTAEALLINTKVTTY